MNPCARMEALLAQLGEEISEADQLAILHHVEACPSCQAQMHRIAQISRVLSSLPPEVLATSSHLSDLELAAFAAHGYEADQAPLLVAHLAECPTCRRELAAVRRTLEQFTELLDEPPPSPDWWKRLRAAFRRALSTRGRRWYAFIGVFLWVLECLCFALVLAHLVVTYTGRLPAFDCTLGLPPFAWVPDGPARLGVFVLAGVLAGLGLRQGAAWSLRLALRDDGPGDRGGDHR